MIKKLINVTNYHLNSMSPIRLGSSRIMISTIYEFVFVFLVLFLLRPSILNNLPLGALIQTSLIISFIFSFTGFVFYFYTNKKIELNKWSYKKDVLRFFKMLSYGGIVFLGYTYIAITFFYKEQVLTIFNIQLFIQLIGCILFIGTLAYLFLKGIDYIYIFKNIKAENVVSTSENEVEETLFIAANIEEYDIILYGKNKNETIKINVDDFLFLQSYGHYIKVYIKISDVELEVKIIRNSLNNILDSFEGHENLLQCHRSYLINMDAIEKIEGNSKKAMLKLYNLEDEIPISRVNYKLIKDGFSISNLKTA